MTREEVLGALGDLVAAAKADCNRLFVAEEAARISLRDAQTWLAAVEAVEARVCGLYEKEARGKAKAKPDAPQEPGEPQA